MAIYVFFNTRGAQLVIDINTFGPFLTTNYNNQVGNHTSETV